MKTPIIAAALLAGFATTPTIAQDQPRQAQLEQFFQKADQNHDGSLSSDEWTAAGRKSRGFKKVDADEDGKVTPAELSAAVAKYGRR